MARRLRALVAFAALVLVAGACSSSTATKPVAGLDARKTTIGGLDITVTPTQLDSSGAAFKIEFDTHTGAPTIDIAANAALDIDGTSWTSPTWSGDGPGGHHRAGTLRFTATGPARGRAQLSITSLDKPVQMTWQLTSEGRP